MPADRVKIEGSGRSSSVGESTRLISAGSAVQVRPPAPFHRSLNPDRFTACPSLDRVRRTIQRHRLATPSTRVVAALSGGPIRSPSSISCTTLADAGELRWSPRASESPAPSRGRRRRAVLRRSRRRGSVSRSSRTDRRPHRRPPSAHRSLEDAAHDAPLRLLRACRRPYGADVVALGHTRRRSGRNLALRLLRGAGTRGFASDAPEHDAMIRPLLDCRREQRSSRISAMHQDLVSCTTDKRRTVRFRETGCGPSCCRFFERPSTRRSPTPLQPRPTSLAQPSTNFSAGSRARPASAPDGGRAARASCCRRRTARRMPRALARRALHRALARNRRRRLIGFADVGAPRIVCLGTAPDSTPRVSAWTALRPHSS